MEIKCALYKKVTGGSYFYLTIKFRHNFQEVYARIRNFLYLPPISQ